MTVNGSDTSREAFDVQAMVYRSMPPAQRVRIAMEMSDHALGIAAAGIRSRHPNYELAEVEWALKRWRCGDELFRSAWPDAPTIDP